MWLRWVSDAKCGISVTVHSLSCPAARGILVPRPGIKPAYAALEGWGLQRRSLSLLCQCCGAAGLCPEGSGCSVAAPGSSILPGTSCLLNPRGRGCGSPSSTGGWACPQQPACPETCARASPECVGTWTPRPAAGVSAALPGRPSTGGAGMHRQSARAPQRHPRGRRQPSPQGEAAASHPDPVWRLAPRP